MSKFKGTQGEWVFMPISKESNGYISVQIHAGTITVYNGISPYIFSEDKEKCIEILEANAKLIAAAPEMLEMLIKIRDCEDLQVEDYFEIKELIEKICV